jgi:aryl-alcohol dehydrogenase-like predicted oxidoreductase
MKYRRLGRSGLEVSALCLGTWDPRADTGPAASDYDRRWLNLLHQAVEAGINLIDTADVYQDGAAERVIGQWMATVDRRQVVIATKAGGRTWGGANGEGAGRKHLREACEASLRRLRTDYIDLYQLHSPDPFTPIEETIETLDLLVNSGEILYWGLSNWPAESAREVADYARAVNRSAPVSLQNGLNLLRAAETADYQNLGGLGLLAYSPLAQGLLSDRQLNGGPAAGSRVASNPSLVERLGRRQARLHRLSAIAAGQGLSLSQLSLAWLLHQAPVTSVVVGVSNRRQLIENVTAIEVSLPAEVLAEVGSAPPVSTALGEC